MYVNVQIYCPSYFIMEWMKRELFLEADAGLLGESGLA